MKKSILFLSVLIASIFTITFTSCTEDDENNRKPFVLSDYLIGTWKSYKSVIYRDGQVYNLEITKEGDLMGAYIELTLKKNGAAVVGNWQKDNEGNAVWTEVAAKYVLQGNEFTLTDQVGNKTQYVYEAQSRDIYFKDTIEDETGEMVIYVYFRKNTSISKV